MVIGLFMVGGLFFFVQDCRNWILAQRRYGYQRTHCDVVASLHGLAMAPLIGFILAGVALAMLAAALAFLRGRVPERRPDQSAEDYWAMRETRVPVIVLWMVMEFAGVVAWIGYALSGELVPVGVAVLAIFALVLVRPRGLET
jgi:hypothetical protein